MKHLKKFNESNLNESITNYPSDEISDIENIFIPIIDLGCYDLDILLTKTLTRNHYSIVWKSESLALSNYSQYAPSEIDNNSIDNFSKRLGNFNKIQDEVIDILKRFLSMGFKILYYVFTDGVNSQGESLTTYSLKISTSNNISDYIN